MEVLGMMVAWPKWIPTGGLSSNQMLIVGGVLLLLAGVFIGRRRRMRVVVVNSAVTEEMMMYLVRIATALERPLAPSAEQISAEVVRKMEEINSIRANESVREIPQSMFGREYRR